MKHDNKNLLKLQISMYLEESLSMIGKMMLEDLFEQIEVATEEEAQDLVEAHYDENVFEIIAPYLDYAMREYTAYKETPEGKEAIDELKEVINQMRAAAVKYDKIKTIKGEGSGNVH